jgi:hypothetical protein
VGFVVSRRKRRRLTAARPFQLGDLRLERLDLQPQGCDLVVLLHNALD